MTGIIITAIIAILVVVLLAYVVMIYNALISLKHGVDKAWSNIDVLLKQRFDELPKLIEVVKGYKIHEQEVLENITKARSMLQGGQTGEPRQETENMITQSLRSLFAVVENYPELKADHAFLELQNRISELENMIADRRELFNEYVNTFNIRQEQFPDVIIAGMMNIKQRKLWEIKADERKDVKISF